MHAAHTFGNRLACGLALALCAAGVPREADAGLQRLKQSIVKIYVTVQREDYDQPWQATMPASGNGTGFIISGRRILSNAHVISDARFIEVQREGDPRKYQARVAMVGHDCDLAMLTVDDERFYDGTRPMALGNALPSLNDEVLVVGYPMGGTRLSLTQGVVSRIDYSLYSHSTIDAHLVMQVDAAINPGNSGGPVLFNGRVVGVAFQGLAAAQNIGYAIPLPVIRHFLDDIADGVYHGYPELGVAHIDLRNEALRADLKMGARAGGVAVTYVDPFGSAAGLVKPRDVLLAIDQYPIADDGTIQLGENPVEFTELVERKQAGNSVRLKVLRDGAEQDLTVPLKPVIDPFAFRYLYDRRPEYFVIGGLVFSPLTRNYLATLGTDLNTRAAQNLYYLSQYAKPDELYKDREQFVALIGRLAAPVNTYCDEFLNQVVTEVNGRPIRRIQDVEAAFAQPTNGFHVLRFDGVYNRLVLDAKALSESDAAIMRQYMVPARAHIESGEASP
jgi:S1-C subfamily serine protease